ncbi:hypothetical protein [Aquimarina pacifica]|nr:hypothetical protein [Aquimarina pacifica]
MKKNLMNTRNNQVKVAKLKGNALENGIVVFIGLLLCTNFLISLKILFS